MTEERKHEKQAELETKLAALQAALLARDPKMGEHLREIHRYLIQFEELAHLLTEEQIAVILQGQQIKVGVILANETAKVKKSGSNKSLKGVTADDL